MKKKSGNNSKFVYPLILVLSIALSIVIISRGQHSVDTTKQRLEDLKEEQKRKGSANQQLSKTIDKMHTREYIERVARDELKMARPGETIYIFEEPEKTLE